MKFVMVHLSLLSKLLLVDVDAHQVFDKASEPLRSPCGCAGFVPSFHKFLERFSKR